MSSGRRNGMTHTWLEYRCAATSAAYVLLVRADHAHALALADHSLARGPGPSASVLRFRDRAPPPSPTRPRQTVLVTPRREATLVTRSIHD